MDRLSGAISNAHTEWLDRQIEHERIGLTDLILCEILQGFPAEQAVVQARRVLKRFVTFETCGETLAAASVGNDRSLWRRGYTVRKIIDCLIATFCITEGHTLLHRDRD